MPIYFNEEVVAVLTMVRSGGERFADADIATMTQVTATVADRLDDAMHLETQRETASALQAAALPGLPSSDPLALAAGYRGASEGAQVGGDWYDAFELQSGRIAGRRRCCGSRSSGSRADDPDEKRPPCTSLRLLRPIGVDRQISSFIATQEPEAFATIICVEIDPATGEGIWASAGHPAPILLNPEGVSVHLRGKPAPPIGSADPQSLQQPIEHPVALRGRRPFGDVHRWFVRTSWRRYRNRPDAPHDHGRADPRERRGNSVRLDPPGNAPGIPRR